MWDSVPFSPKNTSIPFPLQSEQLVAAALVSATCGQGKMEDAGLEFLLVAVDRLVPKDLSISRYLFYNLL